MKAEPLSLLYSDLFKKIFSTKYLLSYPSLQLKLEERGGAVLVGSSN